MQGLESAIWDNKCDDLAKAAYPLNLADPQSHPTLPINPAQLFQILMFDRLFGLGASISLTGSW
jgi:hypothetical protein